MKTHPMDFRQDDKARRWEDCGNPGLYNNKTYPYYAQAGVKSLYLFCAISAGFRHGPCKENKTEFAREAEGVGVRTCLAKYCQNRGGTAGLGKTGDNRPNNACLASILILSISANTCLALRLADESISNVQRSYSLEDTIDDHQTKLLRLDICTVTYGECNSVCVSAQNTRTNPVLAIESQSVLSDLEESYLNLS
ncbi:hypothetical protein J6590_105461 [Homalodisca vitripennis]|nr:hypothetical protein J6590_105461 [Homalodisca vitripennis]